MSNGIKLSKKHGVNPTIPICFWCGQQKNEIALLGKLPGDAEAPPTALIDYNPCDKCEESFKDKILAIGTSKTQVLLNQPPIATKPCNMYPTGHWFAIAPEAFEQNFGSIIEEEKLKNIKECGKVFMDNDLVLHILKQVEEQEAEEQNESN